MSFISGALNQGWAGKHHQAPCKMHNRSDKYSEAQNIEVVKFGQKVASEAVCAGSSKNSAWRLVLEKDVRGYLGASGMTMTS